MFKKLKSSSYPPPKQSSILLKELLKHVIEYWGAQEPYNIWGIQVAISGRYLSDTVVTQIDIRAARGVGQVFSPHHTYAKYFSQSAP